jgi:glucose-6-phosphate 1-epimerase
MVSCEDLNESFAIPGVLAFDEPHEGFARARITTPACTAELYLHGAHLTQWQPAGHGPVLYLSPRSSYAPTKAIRGGIPVIFPWFGARTAEVTGNRTDGAQHGFARTAEWQFAFAALAGEDLHLMLTLLPGEASRATGFDDFRVALEMTLGQTLTVRMTVINEGSASLVFEQALHSYFQVGDAQQVRLHGLAGTEYLDKTESFARKRESADTLVLHGEVDRPYLNTRATISIDDPVLSRRITVAKGGSNTTVVWNPAPELTAKLADLEPDAWKQFVCVETANVAENRVTLQPRTGHIMETCISVERLA